MNGGGHQPQCVEGDNMHILLLLALRLFQGGVVTTMYIRDRFGVSRPTSQRYMLRLERALPVEVSTPANTKMRRPVRTMRLANPRPLQGVSNE